MTDTACANPNCWNSAVNGYCCQKCWDGLPIHFKHEVNSWPRNRRTGEMSPTAAQLVWFTRDCENYWKSQL